MSTIGRWLFRLAVLWLALVPVLFLASFIYDVFVRPHDLNLPGLLAVGSLYYFFVKPLGLGLLVVGFVLRRLGGHPDG